MLAGQSSSFGKGNYDFYTIKTDANGNGNCYQTNIHSAKKVSKTIINNVTISQKTPAASKLNASPNIHIGTTLTDVCNPLGINGLKTTRTDLRVFPNPTNGLLTISLTDLSKEKAVIVIQNILGDPVYKADIVTDNEINLRYLVNGTYFAIIQTTGKTYTQKIIIAK